MTVAIYTTSGHLTNAIESADDIALAQTYLTADDMTQYLDESLEGVVARIRWELSTNGEDYKVEAICVRELTDDEQRVLSEWVSGQNSDGLGEGFEQQDFAEIKNDAEQDCPNCDGSGCNEDDSECDRCDGHGYFDTEQYAMCSFDWMTNKLPWTRTL